MGCFCFGIEVARLADLPCGVIERAIQLVNLFSQAGVQCTPILPAYNGENRYLKEENERLEKELRITKNAIDRLNEVDFDTLSPKKAFDLLWEFKKE